MAKDVVCVTWDGAKATASSGTVSPRTRILYGFRVARSR